jgi:hypothetical protein
MDLLDINEEIRYDERIKAEIGKNIKIENKKLTSLFIRLLNKDGDIVILSEDKTKLEFHAEESEQWIVAVA